MYEISQVRRCVTLHVQRTVVQIYKYRVHTLFILSKLFLKNYPTCDGMCTHDIHEICVCGTCTLYVCI